MNRTDKQGTIREINGPILTIHLPGIRNGEQVKIGELGLFGEVIALKGETALVQSYESTEGVRPGERVTGLGRPLSVELGPGLLGSIFDGVQRPLDKVFLESGDHIGRGINLPALDRERNWHFTPEPDIEIGGTLSPGQLLGRVQESAIIQHRILVPPNLSGELLELAPEGEYRLDDPIGRLKLSDGKNHKLMLYQHWPVRTPAPICAGIMASRR